ncbi:hypothetical protein KBB49_02880 [Candidatus Saccharibacteria bacterium]|nr:hypothetical protein [Candidatus Saccharibacteria bacterium]
MNKLYLVGGPTRVGKSTIMEGLVKKHPMHLIATDAVQQAVRSLFVDDPFQILQSVEYRGYTKFKKFGKGEVKENFEKSGNEVELTQRALIGMLDHYRRNKLDVAMEGFHITPEWVSTISLKGYDVVPAFVGFNSADHTDNIVAHAKQNKHDWINEWLERHNNDVELLRKRLGEQAEINKKTAKKARELGYPYFDITSMPFEEYVETVQNHLLGR